MNLLEKSLRSIRDFTADSRAAVTVELVLVVPLLIWAFFATMIFNDAYRARTQAQAAALHIADAISRTTTIVDDAYLEGMNDVYDFLIADSQTSRLRITSVVWDRDTDQPLVLLSYGTRGMNALPEDNTFQLMSAWRHGRPSRIDGWRDGTRPCRGLYAVCQITICTIVFPRSCGEALHLGGKFSRCGKHRCVACSLASTFWKTPVLARLRLCARAFRPSSIMRARMIGAPPMQMNFDGTPLRLSLTRCRSGWTRMTPRIPLMWFRLILPAGRTPAGPATQTTQAVNNGSGSSNVGTYLGPFGNEPAARR